MAIKFKKILFITAMLTVSLSGAQSSKKMDSVIVQTSLLLYSNPQLAITKAKQLYTQNPDDSKVRISALVIIANSYNALQNYEKSIQYINRALVLAQETDDYINQIRTLGFLGSLYLNLEMNKKAWQYLDRADLVSKQHPVPESMSYLEGNIYLLKGLNYKHNLNCDFAITYFNKAIAKFKNNPNNNISKANIGQAYSQRGQCYFEMGNTIAADSSFNKAIAISEKNNTTALTADALLGKSKILALKKEDNQAIAMLNKALSYSLEGNARSVKTAIYKELSSYYLNIDSVELHRKYQKLFIENNKELIENNRISISQLNAKINSQEDEIFQKDKANYKTIIVVILISIVFLSSIFFIIISKKRNKLKQIKKQLSKKE